MQEQTSSSEEHLVSDEDTILCLSCEYDLRGLPGDLRRCPECGALNLLDDSPDRLESFKAIVKRLRWTAEGAGFCAVFLILFLLACTLLSGVRTMSGTRACATILIACGWMAFVLCFYRASAGAAGWQQVLAQNHIYGCVRVCPLIGFTVGVVILSDLLSIEFLWFPLTMLIAIWASRFCMLSGCSHFDLTKPVSCNSLPMQCAANNEARIHQGHAAAD